MQDIIFKVSPVNCFTSFFRKYRARLHLIIPSKKTLLKPVTLEPLQRAGRYVLN